MRPKIGDIVHYVCGHSGTPGTHYAAIVTHIWTDTCVNLVVFPKGSPNDAQDSGVRTSVVFDVSRLACYSWHRPEDEA